MNNISRNNKLRKFFEIIARNELSTEEEVVEYSRIKQKEGFDAGVFTDEGMAARKEHELIFEGLNYLSTVKDSAVKGFLIDYLKK